MKVLFLYRFLTITVIVDCLGLCYNECYQWAVLLYHESKKEINLGDFFNVDNKFFQGLGKIIDVICLSAFWFFLCIPIVTAGAATTALYYTVNKVIRNNRSYIGREFWHAFKTNFRQSTIVWLILLLLYAIMGFDCYVMYQYAKAGVALGKIYIVFAVLMMFATMWAIYLFPYIARFENQTKMILKNAALIALGNLWKTLLLFALLLAAAFAVYIFPPAVFIIPCIYMLLANFILEKIFQKYMSPEDLEAEKERNMEYFN